MPGPSRPSLGLQGSAVRCTSSVSCSWRSSCKYGFSLVLGSRPPPRTLLSSRADAPKHPGPCEHEPVRHAAGHLPQMSTTQAPRHQGADTSQSRAWWQVGVTSTDLSRKSILPSFLRAQEHQKNTHNGRKYKNEKQVWQFLKKADLEFSCDPTISLPKTLKKGVSDQHLYRNAHSSTSQGSQEEETAQGPLSRWNEPVWEPHEGILLSHEKEWSSATCYITEDLEDTML